MTELRVVSVTVKDVLGATELTIVPGQITAIEGSNGTGKSTALQAIQAGLGGGNLVRLARIGAEGEEINPEVHLLIEGSGNEAYMVDRTGDKVRVRGRVGDTAAFEDVPKPQAWLNSLYDGACSNPVRFLTAADKDRAVLLLEALPLKLDPLDLLRKMGLQASELPPMPTGIHPLEALAIIRDSVFRTRTGVNRDQKGKASAAEQTRRNAPAALPEDPTQEIATLQAERARLAGELAADKERIDSRHREAIQAAQTKHDLVEQETKAAFTQAVRGKRAAHEARAASLRAAVEKQIEEMRASVELEVEALRATSETSLDVCDKVNEAAARDADEAQRLAYVALEERRAQASVLSEQLVDLQARAEMASKGKALLEQADQFDQEALDLETEGNRLTGALDALDTYRRRMAEDLPITGLSIEDKVIRVNGVPFEQLNTAQRVKIAVQVASLRAKGHRLKVVFVDGAEALDQEHFDALVSELKEQGLQAFVARVANQEMAVRAIA